MDQPFRQALQGNHLSAIPMAADGDWEKLHHHAADPRLHDLAFGMGEQPKLDYLKHCALETPDIHVWEAFDGDTHVGYLVFSVWTNLPRATVYLFQADWDEAWWRDGINMLSDLFFALDAESNVLYAHVPLPVSDDTDMWLMELGFAPADQAMYLRKMDRAVFGLPRGVYEMFHEELDEEDDFDY